MARHRQGHYYPGKEEKHRGKTTQQSGGTAQSFLFWSAAILSPLSLFVWGLLPCSGAAGPSIKEKDRAAKESPHSRKDRTALSPLSNVGTAPLSFSVLFFLAGVIYECLAEQSLEAFPR